MWPRFYTNSPDNYRTIITPGFLTIGNQRETTLAPVPLWILVGLRQEPLSEKLKRQASIGVTRDSGSPVHGPPWRHVSFPNGFKFYGQLVRSGYV